MKLTRLLLVPALVLPMALAACGGDDEPAPAPESWAPLRSDYLTKLRLNVGSIDVQDHSTPQGESDLAAQSPVPPAQALAQMARDRLFAAGLTGHADFVIDQASIVRGDGGVLDGTMAVELDVFDASGVRVGFAQARVGRQYTPGSEPENLRNVLYGMTRDMFKSMNVELEFQLKHSLSAFLVTGAAVPAAVTATPLGGFGGAPPPGATSLPPPAPPPGGAGVPGVDLSPGAPQAPPPSELAPSPAPAPMQEQSVPPLDQAPPPDQPPPQQMSPPPGYLQLPPGAPPPQYQ
jgi:hypothetical protein